MSAYTATTWIRGMWANLPFTTSLLVVLCTAVHFVRIFVYIPMRYCCLSWEYFTVQGFFLSPFMHADIVHLLFNMMALVGIGEAMENGPLGSMGLLAMVAALSLGTSVGSLFLQFVISHVLKSIAGCLLGFSGVLFGLIAFEAWSPTADGVQRYVSLCGLANVRASYLPWLVLLASAFAFPASSMSAHLIGLALGAAFARWIPASHFAVFDVIVPIEACCLGTLPSLRRLQKYRQPATPLHPIWAQDGPQVDQASQQSPRQFLPFEGPGHVLGGASIV